MNNTIYKYPIAMTDEQTIPLPAGARILSAQVQRGQICLWASVDREEKRIEPRTFRIIGTGHPVPDLGELAYIATVQFDGGALIFHVFEKP